MGMGKSVKASEWLKKSLNSLKKGVTFSSLEREDSTKYRWRNEEPLHGLELYSEDNKADPIAQFKQSSTYKDTTQNPPADVSKPATLNIYPRGKEVVDWAIVSLLGMIRKDVKKKIGMTHEYDAAAVGAIGFGGLIQALSGAT
ncbi:hypothetical protein BKA70DRAFT_1268333 [Coprinopsis sp. MPI-PUGE-AT-0042]|nr:hypothetical protein BKA70DRAFT_1268333 [Coprinopsis sp. MPI-PUGE-AT-0042]